MPEDTELEPQTKLPGAPPDDPPTEKMTEEQAQEQYDDPKDGAFEDKESADKLAEEVGFKTTPGEGGVDDADAEVTDAADDSASEESEPAGDEVDASLREAAGQLGVPDYMIDAMPHDTLERFVRDSYLKAGRAQQQPEAQPEAKPTPEPESPAEPKEFKFEFDPAVMDDEVRGAIESNLQRMHAQHQSDIEALRKQYGEIGSQLEAQARQAQQESMNQERVRFDEWVASQKDVDLFGEGASSNMDTKSAQWRARSEVWVQKNRIVAGIEALGEPMPPEKKILEWASNSVHARTNGKQAVTEVGKTLKKSASQTLARAGPSRSKKGSKLAELDAGFLEMAMNDPGRDESLDGEDLENSDFDV